MTREDVADLNDRLLRRGSSIRMLSRHHSAGRSWHKAEIRTLLLRPKEREDAERAKMWKINLLIWKHFAAMTLPYRKSESYKRKLYIRRLFRNKVLEALQQKRTENELRRNAVLRGFIERFRIKKKTATISLIRHYLRREKAWNKLRYCCQTYHSAIQIMSRTLLKHARLRRRQRNKALISIKELLPAFRETHYSLTKTITEPSEEALYRRLVSDRLSIRHWKYSSAIAQFRTNFNNGDETFGDDPPYYVMFLSDNDLKSILILALQISSIEKSLEPASRESIQFEEETFRSTNITSVLMAIKLSSDLEREGPDHHERQTPAKIARRKQRLTTPTSGRLSPISARKMFRTPSSRTPVRSLRRTPLSPPPRKLLSPIPIGKLSPSVDSRRKFRPLREP